MTLNQLIIFATIAKHRNLTRASQELHVSQPSVSQQMKLLEGYFGAKLYRRSARGVELTDTGERLLGPVNSILAQVGTLRSRFHVPTHSLEAYSLTVGGTHTPSAILLPRLLAQFRKTHPGTGINLSTNTGDQIERLVLTAKVEIALTTKHPISPRIAVEPFRREKLVFIVPSHHPLARKTVVSLDDIQQVPLVIRGNIGTHSSTERHLRALEDKGLKFNIAMRYDSPNAAIQAVTENMGMGVLYEDVIKNHLKRGEFKALDIRDLKLEGQTRIIYLREKPLSSLAQAFLELLRRSRPKNVRVQSMATDQRPGLLLYR